MKQPFMSVKRNVVFVAICYTFLWGLAFPFVKMCMENFHIADWDNMSKCLVAGIRFSFSGGFTLVFCWFTDETKLKIEKVQIKSILLYAILATTLQYAFTYIGLSRVNGSKGAVYDQLCVFLIILSSGLFFKEDKLNGNKIAGCILGFAGVIFTNIEGFSFSFSFGGEGIMLLAVLCQTVSYFVAKCASNHLSAAKLVGYGQAIGGVILIGFALACGGRIQTANVPALLTLAVLIFISAFAYVLSLMPLKYFPASEISSFNLLITIFGAVTSAILLRENIIEWNYILAVVLISGGILLVNLGRKNHVESF